MYSAKLNGSNIEESNHEFQEEEEKVIAEDTSDKCEL